MVVKHADSADTIEHHSLDAVRDRNYDGVLYKSEIDDSPLAITMVESCPENLAQIVTLQSIVLEPDGKVVLTNSGAAGSTVTFTLERVPGSGGHNHPDGPAGTIKPKKLKMSGSYPQNAKSTFYAPKVCGTTICRATWSGGAVFTFFIDVMIRGLVLLQPRVSIIPTGSKTIHPGNHYGDPGFIAKIEKLADEFFVRFAKPIYVNDISLVWGGVFDHEATWKPPHKKHGEGRSADINSRSMLPAEKTFFKQAAKRLKLKVVEHGTPLHWHVTG
jgi:hypothetical protein